MIEYLSGHEPDFWEPNPGVQAHRFALGNVSQAKVGKLPLIAICMNPSNATDAQADRTVNRLIEARVEHGYSGWIMLNLYPQRAANARDLTAFNQALSDENCAAIERVIRLYGVDEVLGAWGGLKYPVLRTAKREVMALLGRLKVRVFTWDPLTGKEPRHPNPRGERLAMLGPKIYLS